jgi:uncharacterized protein (TIGR02594 family)
MSKLLWIIEAQRHIGVKEIKGAKHNSFIVLWLKSLKAWWEGDEVPWCGTFVAHCMKKAECKLPKYWMRAKDWLNWGQKIIQPCVGCIVVFEREGGGHVGFVVGKDANNNLMVLGGNQGDAVKVSPFNLTRVIGYRWPIEYPIPLSFELPILKSDGKLSKNEA